jgi:hypothetical protein
LFIIYTLRTILLFWLSSGCINKIENEPTNNVKSEYYADQKLIELIRRIDEVNPKQKEEVGTTDSDIFEI